MMCKYLTPVNRRIRVVADFPVEAFHVLILHFRAEDLLHCGVKLVVVDCICGGEGRGTFPSHSEVRLSQFKHTSTLGSHFSLKANCNATLKSLSLGK